MNRLSWRQLCNLAEKYGDSFYLLDVQRFKDNYGQFLASFRSIYPNTNIAYSYKTNYVPELCRLVNSMGGYAEVVSQLEYDLAIRVGVPPQRIIFNGPLKLAREIEAAVLAGSTVNLDSPRELSLIKSLAHKYPDREIGVGMRCNFDVGAGFESRFGFDVEGGELVQAFEVLEHLSNCFVHGLHCHFSSPRTVASYSLRARQLLDATAVLFRDRRPRFLDLGGGFFGKMTEELKSQFDGPVPSYRDYAAAIAPHFSRAFLGKPVPELLLEPGVALTADVMVFVSKIVDVRTVRSRKIALSTGSVQNIKPTMHDKNLPLRIVCADTNPDAKRLTGPLDIVGYTCMEPDCLYKNYHGAVGIGDYAVFGGVGAYTIVLKPPFIRPSPPIIAYDAGLDIYELVKRREEFEDLYSTYVI